MFPLYPLWWEFLSWMNVEFCQMLFFTSVEMVMCFCLSFINVVYHLDWFVYVETYLSPGINLISSWCVIFCMYYWIWFANILRFLHLYSPKNWFVSCSFSFLFFLLCVWWLSFISFSCLPAVAMTSNTL